MVGWLSLALIETGEYNVLIPIYFLIICPFHVQGRDYLLYIHVTCTSLSGTILVITAYTSCGYFRKSRACLSSLYAGASIAAAVWYSIFNVRAKSIHGVNHRTKNSLFLLFADIDRNKSLFARADFLHLDVIRNTSVYYIVLESRLEI